MITIVDAVRDILEPEPTPPATRDVVVDESGAKPLKWRANTLYVWPGTLAENPIETGPTARRDFTIQVLLTGPEAGEEADKLRNPDVSDALDAKREAYLQAVRDNQHGTAWGLLRASEDSSPANLEMRGLSLRLTGWLVTD